MAYVRCFTLACQDNAGAEPPTLTRAHPLARAMFHIRTLCEWRLLERPPAAPAVVNGTAGAFPLPASVPDAVGLAAGRASDAVSALKAARQAALGCVGQAMAIFAPRSSEASLLTGTGTQGRLRFFGATAPVVLGKSY